MRIKNAEVIGAKGWGEMASVRATFEDGKEKELFKFFDDEIWFSADEFIGKTEDEALKLKYAKDKAYLQS